MAIITYVDQYPSADNCYCVGTTANTYKEMWGACICGTTCVASPSIYGSTCVSSPITCGTTCAQTPCMNVTGSYYANGNSGGTCNNACGLFWGVYYCMGIQVAGCTLSHPATSCCILMSYVNAGTCCYCWGSSASYWYDGSGYICPNNNCLICGTFCGNYCGLPAGSSLWCNGSGYICACSNCIVCGTFCGNYCGLPAGSSLWCDAGGYICPCNSCTACGNFAGNHDGYYCASGYGGCSAYITSFSYLCFCNGILICYS